MKFSDVLRYSLWKLHRKCPKPYVITVVQKGKASKESSGRRQHGLEGQAAKHSADSSEWSDGLTGKLCVQKTRDIAIEESRTRRARGIQKNTIVFSHASPIQDLLQRQLDLRRPAMQIDMQPILETLSNPWWVEARKSVVGAAAGKS